MTDRAVQCKTDRQCGKDDLFVLDALLNHLLFAPLTLIFWYCVTALFEHLVIDGESSPLARASVVMVVATSFETYAAFNQDRLREVSEDILRDVGYKKYFLFTRIYNLLMAFADITLFAAIQTFYTEYVGPEVGPMVHVTWAVYVLAMILALKISRSLISSPYFVGLDDELGNEWFDFGLYFKTTPSDEFVVRLFDAVFSVLLVSLILDTFWFTLTFAFDGLIYPSDFHMAMVVSVVGGYALIGLAKYLTPLAMETSAEMERKGRTVAKVVLEDALIFVANFGTILSWKGLTMFSQLLCETLAPIFGVSSVAMAIAGIVVVFVVMVALGVSLLLVFKGPGIDGELTKGKGLVFHTRYYAPEEPHPHTS